MRCKGCVGRNALQERYVARCVARCNIRFATDVETQHQGFYTRNSDDEIATTRSMLLVKRRPATFYGVAPAKPSGTRVRGRIRVPEPFRVPALDEMNGYQNSKTLCDLIYSPLDKSQRESRLFNMLP